MKHTMIYILIYENSNVDASRPFAKGTILEVDRNSRIQCCWAIRLPSTREESLGVSGGALLDVLYLTGMGVITRFSQQHFSYLTSCPSSL